MACRDTRRGRSGVIFVPIEKRLVFVKSEWPQTPFFTDEDVEQLKKQLLEWALCVDPSYEYVARRMQDLETDKSFWAGVSGKMPKEIMAVFADNYIDQVNGEKEP